MIISKVLQQIKIGWRALGKAPEGVELQSITVISQNSLKIRAGRFADGDTEVVLFRFKLDHYPKVSSLPRGNGFEIGLFNIKGDEYIGLVRKREGPLDLFESMLADVMTQVLHATPYPHKVLFKAFLERIQAWQTFMSKRKSALSRKDEIGLIGELSVLKELFTYNLSIGDVISWWRGPFHGIRDFELDCFGIEVKTTTQDDGFEIEVFDLLQLDPVGLEKLYLTAVRVRISDDGKTLPEIVDSIRQDIGNDIDAQKAFEIALKYSGYHVEHEGQYITPVKVLETVNFDIDEKFPSLRRKNIPFEIRNVKYCLELSLMEKPNKTLGQVLAEIGVLKWS